MKKREKLYNFSVQCIPNSIYLTEENKIWIGGFKNIEIFNIDYENKMLVPHKILEGQHTRKITHLVGNRNELWSCSDDGNIFIWNIFVESLVRELHLNTPALFIKLVGDNIWSGNGKTITRWSKSVSFNLSPIWFNFTKRFLQSATHQWMKYQQVISLVR